MIRIKGNKKPVLLLLLLVGFSLLTVKLVGSNFAKSKKVEIQNNKVQQCDNCKGVDDDILTEKVIEDITEDDIIFIKKKDTVDITSRADSGSVKGIGRVDCGAISPDTLLASIRKTCSNGAGPVDFSKSGKDSTTGDGVVVTKDTKVEIVEITYPLGLFLGQSTYQDSNKQIRKKSPEYRSNGQQIDVEYVTRNLSPKESEAFSKSLTKTEKVPFKVEGEVKVGGAEGIGSANPGEYAVANASHNPECTVYGKPCEREFAISDFNVEKSNQLAADSKYGGYLMGQAPGGDKYEKEEENSCLVEDTNYTVWDKGVVEACRQSDMASLMATFKAAFSSTKWKRCTEGEKIMDENGNVSVVKEACIDTKNIGIKMTAIFGDPYECTDDLCANAMLVDKYRSVLSPKEADGIQEVSTNPNKSLTKFVATNCKIRIDGTTVDVYCLWDASAYLLNYQLQAKDSAPKQEDFPENFNSYWRSVKKSSDMSSEKYGL